MGKLASLTAFGALALVSMQALGQEAPSGHRSEALPIGSGRQVFIDGRFLESAWGVKLKLHRPQKTGEITIAQEHPWEKWRVGGYSSVLKVGDTYHMWYDCAPDKDHRYVAYARSEDGIHWEKPGLGLAEVAGTKENNVVAGHGIGGFKGGVHGAMVFWDPNASEGQKWRMVGQDRAADRRLNLYSSPDGIHWSLTRNSILRGNAKQGHHLDTLNVMFWDDRIEKYVAYVRKNLFLAKKQSYEDVLRGAVTRTVARSTSEELDNFPTAEESPVVLGPEDPDGFHPRRPMDYYTNATVKYPWAEDAYYMFPSAYFHYTSDIRTFRDKTPNNAGVVDGRFAASRDGIRWERYDWRAFVELGMPGEFDSKSIYVLRGIVPSVDGRRMYLYYQGSDRAHGAPNDPILRKAGLAPEQDVSAISRLVIRRDGFVSARGSYRGGQFTTPVLTFEGDRLVLNVATSATGAVQVGILDVASGEPIEGYSSAECDLIHTANEINRVVTWRGKSGVGELAGRPVRLRFVVRDADLYAFQFLAGGAE